jgi:hypothetical protein
VPGPGLVPGARPLHLHHLGAEIGEEHRGVGPRENPGEVGDAQPFQRTAPRTFAADAGPFVRRVVLGATGAAVRTTLTLAPIPTTTGAVPVTWQSRLKPSSIATNHV